MKKTIKAGIAILGLAALCAGCSNSLSPALGEPGEEWVDVTQLNQIDGTWKGSSASTSSTDGNGILVRTTKEYTMHFSAAAQTLTETNRTITACSGAAISIHWPRIKAGYLAAIGALGFTVNVDDQNYAITVSGTVGPRPVSAADLRAAQYKINRSGRAVKALLDNEEVTLAKR